jgi:hypothetical protein
MQHYTSAQGNRQHYKVSVRYVYKCWWLGCVLSSDETSEELKISLHSNDPLLYTCSARLVIFWIR